MLQLLNKSNTKKEKDDLLKAERNAIAKMIVRLEQGFKKQENTK